MPRGKSTRLLHRRDLHTREVSAGLASQSVASPPLPPPPCMEGDIVGMSDGYFGLVTEIHSRRIAELIPLAFHLETATAVILTHKHQEGDEEGDGRDSSRLVQIKSVHPRAYEEIIWGEVEDKDDSESEPDAWLVFKTPEEVNSQKHMMPKNRVLPQKRKTPQKKRANPKTKRRRMSRESEGRLRGSSSAFENDGITSSSLRERQEIAAGSSEKKQLPDELSGSHLWKIFKDKIKDRSMGEPNYDELVKFFPPREERSDRREV
ncbi:hypothetical protein AAMO2058_001568500, partial [Amorphochlora amoebiformis]